MPLMAAIFVMGMLAGEISVVALLLIAHITGRLIHRDSI